MTRQEQIEEMEKVIINEQILIANTANGFKQLMQKGVEYCHAKAMYDAGYRKVLFDTENGKGVDCTQYVPWELAERHTKNEVEKTRKETAREILNLIIDEGNVNPLTSFYMLPFKIFNKIKREYGVEVEEQ